MSYFFGNPTTATERDERDYDDPSRVYDKIQKDQFKLLCRRLELEENDDNTSFTSCSGKRRTECLGVISLAKTVYHDNGVEKVIPLPLVKKNREWLESIGFKISEDRLYAVYQEPEEIV